MLQKSLLMKQTLLTPQLSFRLSINCVMVAVWAASSIKMMKPLIQ